MALETRYDQILKVETRPYFNFINSIDSEETKKAYSFCLSKFLCYNKLDLISFLRSSQDETVDVITKYLVSQKKSKTYKNLILSSIKHACEMNDVILNWKKLKKFINSEKSGNEINGKDRAYEHEEIQKLTNFCEQRIKTVFLILASTGIRSGVLRTLRISDLEKMDDIYKITVYSGDKEEYLTFCTP
jgi:integrase